MPPESSLAEAGSTQRSQSSILALLRDYPVFLWCALAIAPASQFANYLDPTDAVFKGQSLAVLIALVGSLIAFAAWIPFRSTASWTPLGLVTLGLILTACIFQLTLIQANGSLFNVTVGVMIGILLMLLIKPPTSRQSQLAIVFFCFLIVAEAIASLILDHFGLAPSGFLYYRVGWSRLPFISDVLGIDTRWEGPFGNVNFAGPMGAFILLIGLTRKGRVRILLAISGAFILLLSQARDSLVALAAGLIVLFLTSGSIRDSAHATAIRLGTVFGAIAAAVISIVIVDPTLGLRTDVWQDFVQLARNSPWFGVGDSGVTDYMLGTWHQSDYPPSHAHSVLLDLTARYGILMGLLSIAILVCIVVLAVRRARTQAYAGLVIITFVIVAGMAETLYSWIYWSVQFVPLMAALLFTGTESRSRSGTTEP